MRVRSKPRHLLRSVAIGIGVATTVLAAALGIFLAAFGEHRLLLDFWPLDTSRVGPNLCASMFLVVLVVAHNEYRTVSVDLEQGERVGEILEDAAGELLHPTEAAEEGVAGDLAHPDDEGSAVG